MKRALEIICLVLLMMALVLVEMMRINTPVASVYDLPAEQIAVEETAAPEVAATPEPTPEPAPAKRFCSNCGAPLNPGAQFCGECGTKQ